MNRRIFKHSKVFASDRLILTAKVLLAASFLLCGADYSFGQTVRLYPSTIRVEKGKSKTITAVAYDQNGQPVFDAVFDTFSTGDNSIAGTSPVLVAGDNIYQPTAPPPNLRTIAGVSSGTTTIRATWNGIASEVASVVVDDPASTPMAVVTGENGQHGGNSLTAMTGEPIELNAELSKGVDRIEWIWGDGDMTTEQLSAAHAYLNPGTYNIRVRITNSSRAVSEHVIAASIHPVPAPTRIINVTSVAELHSAYNSTTGGEHIVIPAGSTLVGEVSLAPRNLTNYVTIRSSAVMPGLSKRVSPDHAGLVVIRGSSNNSVPFTIENSASKIRLVGIKFEPKYMHESVGTTSYLLKIGEPFTQTSTSENPNRIILEHCVINPADDVNVAHGILNDGYRISIISSWLGNIKTFGGRDSQAVVSFDGKGAHVYNNDFFEASSENVMYGGAVPSIQGITPQNIEFRRNHFSKRLSWRVYGGEGHNINVKNLFETKNARRIYIEGSVFENHWDALRSQRSALSFKSTPSPGMPGEFVPWAVSEEITLENNKVNHVFGGFKTGVDNYWLGSFHGLKPNNIKIVNTLFDDVSNVWGPPEGGSGNFLQLNSVEDFSLDHVTVINRGTSGTSVSFITNNNFRFSVTNSIFGLQYYGIKGGGVGPGIRTLNSATGGEDANICTRDSHASWMLERSVMPAATLVGCNPTDPSTYNAYPTSFDQVGFADMSAGNFALVESSPYKRTGTNNTDPGIDQLLLDKRTSCTVSGSTAACMGLDAVENVNIGGRVVNTSRRGANRVTISITGADGMRRETVTSPLGYFQFASVPSGSYTVNLSMPKRGVEMSRTISVFSDVNDLEFIIGN